MKATVLSLSTMVTVALTMPGRAPPVRLESWRVKVSLPSTRVSGVIATVKLLTISPLAKVRVLVAPV